jgi:hypothetical protein
VPSLAQRSVLLWRKLQPATTAPVCDVVLQVLQEFWGRLTTLGNLADFLRVAERVFARERCTAVGFQERDVPPGTHEKGHIDPVATLRHTPRACGQPRGVTRTKAACRRRLQQLSVSCVDITLSGHSCVFGGISACEDAGLTGPIPLGYFFFVFAQRAF